MPRKLAVKRLTESDLTIFEYHHRRTAGKQKAINLNADVFVDELYPQLPDLAQSRNGRFPVDLYIYGPGFAEQYNLQRKILKFGSYKNWRLDGEFIHSPSNDETRFDSLIEGDFAVLEFIGEITPDTCKAVLVGQRNQDDASLHLRLATFMGNRRMARIVESELEACVEGSGVPGQHPIQGLLLEASLEDAVYFGEQGTTDLLRQAAVRTLSRSDFDIARTSAEESGAIGEEFVNAYLASQLASGLNCT